MGWLCAARTSSSSATHATVIRRPRCPRPACRDVRAARRRDASDRGGHNQRRHAAATSDQQGSTGVTIDGLSHTGVVTDATLAGRYYEGVAATATNYTVATTTGPDGAAWVRRFAGGGNGALDATFNAGTGRVVVPAVDFHAIRLGGDGSAYVAGEAVAATAADRTMVVARILATGGFGAFGTGGIARVRVGAGNNTGEALVLQGTNIIVGGAANLAGRASFGIARLTAAGVPDLTFGTGGQTTSPIGSPQVNAYITGMALLGRLRRSLRARERPGRPRHDRRALLPHGHAAAASAARRHHRRRRRPDHGELRPHQRHGQRQRHGELLVDRVRHDDGLRLDDGSPAARRHDARRRRAGRHQRPRGRHGLPRACGRREHAGHRRG